MKGQISVVEPTMMIALFIFFTFAYTTTIDKDTDYAQILTVEDIGNLLYQKNETKVLVLMEDMSNSSVNGNWTNVTNLLSSKFTNYEIKISNLSTEKTIVSCTANTDKKFTERLIAIGNNSLNGTRVLRLGVCT